MQYIIECATGKRTNVMIVMGKKVPDTLIAPLIPFVPVSILMPLLAYAIGTYGTYGTYIAAWLCHYLANGRLAF